jgi:hypothetical protein
MISSFLFHTSFVLAADYYVASDGRDHNKCGGQTDECLTIDYALELVRAGDTIRIRPGRYIYTGSKELDIDDPVNHADLTITAADLNNKPVLSFTHKAINPIEIHKNVTGVTLSYLEISCGPSRKLIGGPCVAARAEGFVIDHCEVYNWCTGIALIWGVSMTASNNVVHSMGRYETDHNRASGKGAGIVSYNYHSSPPAKSWDEKIYIYNNEVYDVAEDGYINVNTHYKYIEIANNNFHDNYEDGIDLKDAHDVRIHHNKLHDNWSNGIVSHNAYPSHNVSIWNNEIYNNGWSGVIMKSRRLRGWKLWDNKIYNNCQKPHKWRCR